MTTGYRTLRVGLPSAGWRGAAWVELGMGSGLVVFMGKSVFTFIWLPQVTEGFRRLPHVACRVTECRLALRGLGGVGNEERFGRVHGEKRFYL